MTRRTIARWAFVHRWTSLVCTAFLLMLCVTGLPLIFHDEIDRWVSPPAPLAIAPGKSLLPLDALVARAIEAHPGEVPLYLSFDDDRPVANVTSAPATTSPATAMHFDALDRRTGAILPPRATPVTDWLLRLHTDMLVGERGELFLGAMGVMFVIALMSGMVLYVPFTARLGFTTLRRDRGPRINRLDRHNLLGALLLGWVGVVAITGTLNTLAGPVTRWWQAGELAGLNAGTRDAHPASLDAMVATALAAVPGSRPQFVAFPGAAYAGPTQIGVYLQGATPLTRRMLTPVFLDPQGGRIVRKGQLPVAVAALLLAQPLHFGDYGGLPMKLCWAVLDIMTIALLWTGLALWLRRRTALRASERPSAWRARVPAIQRPAYKVLMPPILVALATIAALIVALLGQGNIALVLLVPPILFAVADGGGLSSRLSRRREAAFRLQPRLDVALDRADARGLLPGQPSERTPRP